MPLDPSKWDSNPYDFRSKTQVKSGFNLTRNIESPSSGTSSEQQTEPKQKKTRWDSPQENSNESRDSQPAPNTAANNNNINNPPPMNSRGGPPPDWNRNQNQGGDNSQPPWLHGKGGNNNNNINQFNNNNTQGGTNNNNNNNPGGNDSTSRPSSLMDQKPFGNWNNQNMGNRPPFDNNRNNNDWPSPRGQEPPSGPPPNGPPNGPPPQNWGPPGGDNKKWGPNMGNDSTDNSKPPFGAGPPPTWGQQGKRFSTNYQGGGLINQFCAAWGVIRG